MKQILVYGMLLLAFGMPVQADEAQLTGVKVVRTLVADDGRWGGCMALLDRSISTTGLNCRGAWVSFSCSGDFTTKDVAYKMLESAQMALVLDRDVSVTIDDALLHNGWCYANRIEILSR